jgi:hypothetical protein
MEALRWKFRGNVSTFDLSRTVIVQELLHRRHSNMAKLLDGPNQVPDEFVGVAPRLVEANLFLE